MITREQIIIDKNQVMAIKLPENIVFNFQMVVRKLLHIMLIGKAVFMQMFVTKEQLLIQKIIRQIIITTTDITVYQINMAHLIITMDIILIQDIIQVLI